MTRPTNPRLVAWDHDIETIDLARAALPAAIDRARDARRGYPGSGFGGGGSSTGEHSDPTAAAAMRPDLGGEAMRVIDDISRRHHAIAQEFYAWVTQWSDRQPSAKAQRDTERANTVVPECQHHREAIATHEPLHVRGTAGGVLDEPMPLCRWCWDHTRQSGALPPKGAMLDRQAGRRVMIRRQPSRA